MIIAPSIGRVVWFYRAYHRKDEQPYAALVCYVHSDRMVNLAWFDHDGVSHNMTSVPLIQEGDAPSEYAHCTWVPYQLGQAKRAA